MIITREQAIKYTVPHLVTGGPSVMLYDTEDSLLGAYWCPTKKWLEEWHRNFRHELTWTPLDASWFQRNFGQNLFIWQKRNDCDNRSLQALVTAQNLFVYTKDKEAKKAKGVAFFEVAGPIRGGHAMNIVLVDEGGEEPFCYLIEPQNTYLELERPTEEEIYKIKHIRG